MAPMSSACVVTAMMWLSSRVISAKRTGSSGGVGVSTSGPHLRPHAPCRAGTGSEPLESRELRALSRSGCLRDGSWSTHGNGMGTRGATPTSDPLSPRGRADVEQLLHGQGIGLLVAHHGDVVQTVEVGQRLPNKQP